MPPCGPRSSSSGRRSPWPGRRSGRSLPRSTWQKEAANHTTLSGNFVTLEKRLTMKGGAPLRALAEIRHALTTKPLYQGMEKLFLNLMVREMKAKHSLLEATDASS